MAVADSVVTLEGNFTFYSMLLLRILVKTLCVLSFLSTSVFMYGAITIFFIQKITLEVSLSKNGSIRYCWRDLYKQVRP